MPSVYQSCSIRDEAAEALAQLKQHLDGVRQDFEAQMADVATAMADLEGSPVAATATIGSTVDVQIKWTAVATGRAGNRINIQYIYLGPIYNPATMTLNVRWPSSEVSGNTINMYLASDVNGDVTLTADWHLLFWMLDPAVAALVTGALVGTGGDVPAVQATTYLSGGKDRSITLVESAANDVAKPLGYRDYRDLLKAVDIPVIETAADAAKFLQEGGKYVIVNSKLLVVSGTNLVALNKLWVVTGKNITKFKEVLAQITLNLPTLVTTQNITITTYERVCGTLQPITTVVETYRAVNTSDAALQIKYGGTVDSFNHYVFWGENIVATRVAYERVAKWGLPEEYVGDVLGGGEATQEPWLDANAPTIYTVEQLDLLDVLKFTDAEITELLNLSVDGIKIPYKVSITDRTVAMRRMMTKPPVRDNGMRHRVKAPIASMQALSVSKTMDDDGLAKELATRGKACARSSSRLKLDMPNMPDVPDLPNLPFDRLPDPAKKIESAYGALSSGVAFATRTFDSMLGTLEKTVKSILNKVQSAASLADNVFDNDMVKCLLGTGIGSTGAAVFSGVGEGMGLGGGNSIPSIKDVVGGLAIPVSMLKDFFKKMAIELDETITAALETAMKLLQIPLCVIQSLLKSLLGFDLGGILNPCGAGKDANTKCPPEETQGIVDASTALTDALDSIPSLDDLPTTEAVEETVEAVQQFTGTMQKTITSTTSAVTRGIQQVMDDISKSVDAKLEMVDKLEKAIKELFRDVKDIKENIDENDAKSSGCMPPVLGFFTDEISNYI